MYFKKLELVGFKSFFNKTTLHFEPGITAVVGPNGCGKSNIVDSLRWVLGEQSAKSLRGSDMQDVIFNGTDVKEAVGMAEVTLAFDNKQRFFNFEHDEVAITRRLFRSGESEYLLNKTPVRLKDITDLLLGTGIGAESYSIIAQGKIDLVLSSRPEDRRLIFDEASGITKYKAHKREALRKLEETEQNLLRVNDIITEVKRQIWSLERQANKARKYKEVFEELKSKEISLSLLEKEGLLKEKNAIIQQLTELEAGENELIEIVRQQELKISNRQSELRSQEAGMMALKNLILNLENQVVRNNEHASFNKEKIIELSASRRYLEAQIEQAKNKITSDQGKLNQVKAEYGNIKKNMEVKEAALKEKETQINALDSSIRKSLDAIAEAKRDIMELVVKIANTKNDIADFNSQQQVHLARKKRLEIEKAKVNEEKVITEDALRQATEEAAGLKQAVENLNLDIGAIKNNLEKEAGSLGGINAQITDLEKKRLTLESHKDFLEKLKTKYEDISESMNAVIYLDKPPKELMSGLVVKIKEQSGEKLSGEAKPVEMDTAGIQEKLNQLEVSLTALKNDKAAREAAIAQFNKSMEGLQQELRNQEISLANKETSRLTIQEQFNKIKEEEDIIVLELLDIQKEISLLEQKMANSQFNLAQLNKTHRETEDLILQEEGSISLNRKAREEVLVAITQVKTELEALSRRVGSDEATLKILEETCQQDCAALNNIEKQIQEALTKKEALEAEIRGCEDKITEFSSQMQKENKALQETEARYRELSEGAIEVVKKIEADRKELDSLKNRLHQLQMQDKEIDYKYTSIKERMLVAYKFDLEGARDGAGEIDAGLFRQEIEQLKAKLDSYGTVNLVAIEEYDELKKRYDFLIQQQNDLASAKESLHEAILKINRTTKQMFLETFEKVKEEFRNYFRLLFNGGDARLFLIDENDPLESGIEIICRPPGKKLQNVLLLSGGEKSLSAIALIFAIFKVKPSPFCILDEIDAALDEANVDRFSRMLHEFVKQSQFIVITHNKRTIVNANVMYGITMEESGISKIVSVKFADKEPQLKDKEPQAIAEPV